MVKWYGVVFHYSETQAIDAPIEEFTCSLETQKKVYDFIIAECDEIINNSMLPNATF